MYKQQRELSEQVKELRESITNAYHERTYTVNTREALRKIKHELTLMIATVERLNFKKYPKKKDEYTLNLGTR